MLIPGRDREPELLSFDLPDARGSGGSHRIACAQWGRPGAGPTLLCVHGLTRNGRDFDFLARAMAQDDRLRDVHVLAPDMRGRGASPWLRDPAGYTNPDYLSDLLLMLNSLGVRSLHWLGTSMGGILGMMAAQAAPGLLRSLILNDIGCLIPAAGLLRIRDSAAGLPERFATRAEAEAGLRLRCATFGIRDETHWQHLFTHGLEPEGGGWRFRCDPAVLRTAFAPHAAVADVELWPLWEAVRPMPVLLIRGAQSDLLRADTAQAMQASHPALTCLEIGAAGHAPALMADHETAPIREWLGAALHSV